MEWKNEAVNDLKSYNQRKRAIDSLNERIKILEQQMTAIKAASTAERVMGGKTAPEEKWLDNITERERLEFSRKIAEALVELTEKGLNSLSIKERRVLEGFYISPESNHVLKLCTELFLEKSSLYRLKDEALRKFTISQYGAVEI